MKIQNHVKQINGIEDVVYNPECYSLTIYVKQSFWDCLYQIKIEVSKLLNWNNLDRAIEKIIYTPIQNKEKVT